MSDKVGAAAEAATRSHASHSAPSGLRPPGFDQAQGARRELLCALAMIAIWAITFYAIRRL